MAARWLLAAFLLLAPVPSASTADCTDETCLEAGRADESLSFVQLRAEVKPHEEKPKKSAPLSKADGFEADVLKESKDMQDMMEMARMLYVMHGKEPTGVEGIRKQQSGVLAQLRNINQQLRKILPAEQLKASEGLQDDETEGLATLLFYAIDADSDTLINLAECRAFLAKPQCLSCVQTLEDQSSLTVEDICQQFVEPGDLDGEQDLETFMQVFAQLHQDAASLLGRGVRNLMKERATAGKHTGGEDVEDTMGGKRCR